MARSERQPGPARATGRWRGAAPRDPLNESWDPADDEGSPDPAGPGDWDWHARASWGQRAVAAFPWLAMVAAVGLFAFGVIAGSPPVPAPAVVAGTGGARLVARPGVVPTDATAPGGTARFGVVTFATPSGPPLPVQGSTSLALPPYLGWEANGSAGPENGFARAGGGLLHVGLRRPTPAFRGWFLTTSGTVPSSCAFQFDASSPPPVPPSTGGVGELVMAVQTSTTATTGDIDYVVVAEVVKADGSRMLEAGYSTGRLRNAVEHVLKAVPWSPGELQVSVLTDGRGRLEVRVNGSIFLDASGLDMGITPPFQPYLEVQARRTAYTVAFSRYASVCGDGVTVEGVPPGTVAVLGSSATVASGGAVRLPMARTAGPVSGTLELLEPVPAGAVRFARYTYWPGARFGYRGAPTDTKAVAPPRPFRPRVGSLISVGGPHPAHRPAQWPVSGF